MEESSLGSFLEKMMLTDNSDSNEDSDASELTLMTFHSSKGLEFNTVFMVGVEEELLPHKKTIQMAQKRLYMTYTSQRKIHNKEIPRFPSRFINTIDEDLYHFQDKTTFEGMSEEEEKNYKDNFFSNMMSLLDD